MERKERVSPHDDPDVQLMLRFQKGDMEAFQQLFNKFSPSVVNFAFRFVGSRERAEELAQEVFLQVYRSKERYEPKAKFSTWLFKIANNHCLNEVRKGEYRVSHESLDSSLDREGDERERDLPDTNPRKGDDILAAKQAAYRIQQILRRLPESQRSALMLSRLEGMSYQEVAEVLGTTEKAVKSLVFRATHSLREGLREFLESHEDL
ncbi:MAG TPA: RNA polymerase sigma factor [Methylomirabilota bacterium]|jgi:RNA polymerase sigma-70 factor (ECF subfamily)|nr:RNA polymerase sigma factor [Methylomirabilota bacterium]